MSGNTDLRPRGRLAHSTAQVQHTAGAAAQQALETIALRGLQPGDVVEVNAWFSAAANNANTKACYIYFGATGGSGSTYLAKNGGMANNLGVFITARFVVRDATTITFYANDGTSQNKTVDLAAGVMLSLEMYLAAADTCYLEGYDVRRVNGA